MKDFTIEKLRRKRKFSKLESGDNQTYSRKLQCSLCQKEIETIFTRGKRSGWKDKKTEVTRHHATSHLIPHWHCCFCSWKFKYKEDVKKHLKNIHKNVTTLPILSISNTELQLMLEKKAVECFPGTNEKKDICKCRHAVPPPPCFASYANFLV